MAFELPPLSYDYAALEPYIDATTMQIHHECADRAPRPRCMPSLTVASAASGAFRTML